MGKEFDERSILETKERVLRDSLESYLSSVKLQLDNMERKERLLRNIVLEERAAAKEPRGQQDRVAQARGLLIKELIKSDPEVVRSLLVPVVKEMNLTKDEARRVLMDE